MIPFNGPGSWGRETGTVLDRTMLAWKEAVMSDNLRDVHDGLEADFFRDYRIVSAGRTLTRRYLCSLDQDRRGVPASDSLGAPGQQTMEQSHFAAGGAGRGRDAPYESTFLRVCFWMILPEMCDCVTGGPIGNLSAVLGRKMSCSEI